MKKIYYIFFFIATILMDVRLKAQYKQLSTQKQPAWVTRNEIDYTNKKLDHEAEDGWLDLAYEKQVSLGEQAIYYRKAIKIISEAGVQNKSEISISFDPSYEQLILHSIKIVREKESIDKLELKKIKIIQQESELDRHVYNETRSAILLLEDVRKGDIIEYSYTLKGFNSIFNGKYSDMYETGFSVPAGSLYYKMIVPNGRMITIKNSQTAIQPVINKSVDETTYEWKLSNVPALHAQDNIPSWYDPYPAIMVSEYKSWKEVNDWAMKLFPFADKVSPAIQKKTNDIRTRFDSPEQRILAALHFVQDDVRYLGIEMGENSHKPHSAEKVLVQRFGDCKDKSYLLCTLLRALGIEANPVLINTSYKRTIRDWLPAATAFDHATVKVKLNDSSFFFDPTIPYQRGAMDEISYPDYQCGLVIGDNTTELADISMPEKGLVKIKEIFDIPDMTGHARLTVTTDYSGSFADDTRNFMRVTLIRLQQTVSTSKTMIAPGFLPHLSIIQSLSYGKRRKGRKRHISRLL